jgi:hypothetical protein
MLPESALRFQMCFQVGPAHPPVSAFITVLPGSGKVLYSVYHATFGVTAWTGRFAPAVMRMLFCGPVCPENIKRIWYSAG